MGRRAGRADRRGWLGHDAIAVSRCGRCSAVLRPACPILPLLPSRPSAQVPFEQAVADLASPDAGTRLRAVQLLKQAAYPEAAVPLAALVTDPQDEIQLEAIAAELNIFLAEPVVPQKRVGARGRSAQRGAGRAGVLGRAQRARRAAGAGRSADRAAHRGARREPARRDRGAVRVRRRSRSSPAARARRDLLRAAGPDIAAFIGSSDPAMRYAAVRVLGRVFATARAGRADRVDGRRRGDHRAQRQRSRGQGGGDARARRDALRARRAGADRSVQLSTARATPAEAALDALAHIAHPASVPLFTAQLAEQDAALRGIAIEGLARAGDASQLAGDPGGDRQGARAKRDRSPAPLRRCCSATRPTDRWPIRSAGRGCASRRSAT